MRSEIVSKVKRSVKGKRYSELTKEEFDVLFADDRNLIETVCAHNGIIDDSAKINPKLGPKTGSKAMPEFAKPKPKVAAK